MPDRTLSTDIMSIGSKDALTEILRQGAQQMLARAIENEVAEYLGQHADQCDEMGRRLVVRNGYLPTRDIQTGVGLVEVHQPRVRDKRYDEQGERLRFTRRILPPYLRRTQSLDELIPWLYLRGSAPATLRRPCRRY
jgi:putative transposase